MLRTLIRAIFLFSFIPGLTQVGNGGLPYSFTQSVESNINSHKINTLTLGLIDNTFEIRKTDSINNHQYGKKAYYGKGVKIDIDILDFAEKFDVQNGSLWRMKIKSAEAFGLQVYFKNFWIPEGGQLFFYDQTKNHVLGSFGAHNNNEKRQFGTQYVAGDEIYIEYFQPSSVTKNAELKMDYAVHAFKNVWDTKAKYGNGGTCNINIACEPNNALRSLGKSVALILAMDNNNDYANWCTGSLLNNTAEDGTPYFLSASHCSDITRVNEGWELSRFNVTNWIFVFDYEFNSCITNFNDTLPTKSVFGAELLAVDQNNGKTSGSPNYHSDFLFLKLDTDSSTMADYGVTFSGWEASESTIGLTSQTISIHHPSGDAKKISKANGAPVSDNLYSSGEPNTNWRVVWTAGVTEPGSSGCPLYNDQYRVIGQLLGGGASCINPQSADYYGKFSVSWVDGDLAQWLDPENTGSTSIDAFPNLSSTESTFSFANLFIYPNFVDNHLSITISPAIFKSVKLRIFNSIGVLMYEDDNYQYSENETIEVASLKTGLYILELSTNSQNVSTKFYKK